MQIGIRKRRQMIRNTNQAVMNGEQIITTIPIAIYFRKFRNFFIRYSFVDFYTRLTKNRYICIIANK